jgi:hypothetical protein
MRILAKSARFRMSPLLGISLALALALSTQVSGRLLLRGMHGAARAGQATIEAARLQVEPALFIGGLLVSRSRHIIAGSIMGCTAGATVGGGAAAVASLATGGVALPSIPLAAGIGCLVGGATAAAIAYPLDSWALEE